jgi:prepilin-type N-terminal cleavage/methylation domain-containing protein
MRLVTKQSAGFTLVEIMIVVAIIGLLAAIAIPNFAKARETANRNACVNNLRQIDGAKDLAALENGLSDGGAVDTYVGAYLKGGLPTCPVGRTAYAINPVGTPPACASAAAASHNGAYSGAAP